MSSRTLVRLVERGGGVFVRQHGTSHAVYERIVEGRRYRAPIQMGKKSLDPNYCKRILKQLKFTDAEIQALLTS